MSYIIINLLNDLPVKGRNWVPIPEMRTDRQCNKMHYPNRIMWNEEGLKDEPDQPSRHNRLSCTLYQRDKHTNFDRRQPGRTSGLYQPI